MYFRRLRGPHDLRIGRQHRAVGDIVPNRCREQEHVLLHDADVASQRLERDVANVDAIDQDPASGGVVETRQQVHDGALAAPGRAQEGDDLARLDLEGDVPEDRGGAVILKGDVVEGNVALDLLQLNGARPLLHRRGGIEHLEDALARGDSPCRDVDEEAHHADGHL